MALTVTTNHVPRDIIDASELSEKERADVDYLNWPAIEEGAESASFFRYKGSLYDLGEFSADYGITKNAGLPESLSNWDGYYSDSAFSAIVIKYTSDDESVIVGTVIS